MLFNFTPLRLIFTDEQLQKDAGLLYMPRAHCCYLASLDHCST